MDFFFVDFFVCVKFCDFFFPDVSWGPAGELQKASRKVRPSEDVDMATLVKEHAELRAAPTALSIKIWHPKKLTDIMH